MNTNNNYALEKLYLDATSKCGDTVFTIRNNDTDVEYTRTDAFIEKADKFIGSFFHPDDTELRDCLLKKFHEYME